MTTRLNNLCGTHQDKPTFEPCDTCNRLTVERMIVFRCVFDLLAHGYALSVNDGEETTLGCSTDPDAIMMAMFTTDEDNLLVHKKLQDGAGFHENHSSFVRFIYGNSGWDVVSDYGTSLEPAFVTMTPLIEQLDLIISEGWLYNYAGTNHGIHSLLAQLPAGSYDTERLEIFGKQMMENAAAEVALREFGL